MELCPGSAWGRVSWQVGVGVVAPTQHPPHPSALPCFFGPWELPSFAGDLWGATLRGWLWVFRQCCLCRLLQSVFHQEAGGQCRWVRHLVVWLQGGTWKQAEGFWKRRGQFFLRDTVAVTSAPSFSQRESGAEGGWTLFRTRCLPTWLVG
jgi:hypothetical protein